MKCFLANCRADAASLLLKYPMCSEHLNRHQVDFNRRFGAKRGTDEQYRSWLASWLQMVDAELLNAMVVPVNSGKSWPGYEKKREELPLEATKKGQAELKKRKNEYERLEDQLARDVAEYARGRRMELELELKGRRAAESQKNGAAK